jgi:uncharacterized protein (DUF1330 family)
MAVNPNVSWRKYINSSNPSIDKYLSDFGDRFIQQTFQRLSYAIKNKKSEIILIRFKDSDIVSKIKKEEYIQALEVLLELCVKLEKYEICRDIHNSLKILKLKKVRGNRNPITKVTST